MNRKRMHPMMIVVSLIKTIKSLFIFIIYFFVIALGDQSLLMKIVQGIFLTGFILLIISFILKWLKTSYELQEHGIAIREGIFQKKERYIAFDRVQNVQKNKPFYLNMLGLVALKFETGAEGDGADLVFPALKNPEAERIEQVLDFSRKIGTNQEENNSAEGDEPLREDRIVHFASTSKDMLKASFLSFSYFAIIPVIYAFISNAKDLVDIEKYEKGFLKILLGSWQSTVLIGTGALLIMVIVGVLITFVRYGNSIISSDDQRIYLRSGMLSERHFSIRKNQVQAVKVHQSLLKRLLGLASVELVTAGGVDEEMEGGNTLYPFLPASKANQIITELLPGFEIRDETVMKHLPKKSFIARLLRMPWVFIIGLIVMVVFYRAYWYLSFILLVLSVIERYLDFKYSRFLLSNDFIQIQTGGIYTHLTIVSRTRMIELDVRRSILKERFGLSTLKATTRGKPVNVQEISDIPDTWAREAYLWYSERQPVIDEK